MGSGDLNLKKSWHTGTGSSIAAVQKAEAEALVERKKLAARLEEIREERLEEARQRELEANGGKAKADRVEWMYAGPGSGQAGDNGDNESFLLGKRRIDKLLQDKEVEKLKAQESGKEALATTQNFNVVRDTALKVTNDPLFLIRQQEQAAYAAIMADPSKRRHLFESMGLDDSGAKSSKERKHKHKHHHRHHRHRDEDSDGERGSRRRRRSDTESRSRSPKKYDSEDEDRRRRRRESPERRRRRSSPGAARDSRDTREHRRRDYSASRSPKRTRREDSRDRYESRSHSKRDDRERMHDSSRQRRDYDGDRSRHQDRPNVGQPRKDRGLDDEARARKLAAMQDAASNLDQARERRLAEIEEAEAAARESDQMDRQRSNKYGGGREFMNNLHKKAGDAKLADRVGQGRKGFQRDDD